MHTLSLFLLFSAGSLSTQKTEKRFRFLACWLRFHLISSYRRLFFFFISFFFSYSSFILSSLPFSILYSRRFVTFVTIAWWQGWAGCQAALLLLLVVGKASIDSVYSHFYYNMDCILWWHFLLSMPFSKVSISWLKFNPHQSFHPFFSSFGLALITLRPCKLATFDDEMQFKAIRNGKWPGDLYNEEPVCYVNIDNGCIAQDQSPTRTLRRLVYSFASCKVNGVNEERGLQAFCVCSFCQK